MGDLEFLSIKEFENKLRTDEGQTIAAGDIATLTANTGKDMYIGKAKFSAAIEGSNDNAYSGEVVLKVNGLVKETARYSIDTTTAGAPGVASVPYEFKNLGLKVTTGQIIKIESITQDADITIEGFITCWEEDTGKTPQIPSI